MIAYLDTSAIVKLLVRDESGTDVVGDLWEAADAVFTSRIAQPEGRAALASARRAGRLTKTELTRAKQELARVLAEVAVVELVAPLAEAAGEIAERFELRALDAVHLASALVVAEEDTVVVTWDQELATAASGAGLGVAPPGT